MVKSDFFTNFGNSILMSIFGALWVFVIILGALLTIALLVILVRYLLVTTRAAQVYIDLNAPAKPAPAAPAAAKAAPAKAPAAKTSAAKTTTKAPVAKPPAKTTPKTTPKSQAPKA